MEKLEFLKEVLDYSVMNQDDMVKAGVSKEQLTSFIVATLTAATVIANEICGKEVPAQQRIPFRDEDTVKDKTPKNNVSPNKPADTSAKDTVDESNKTKPVEEKKEDKVVLKGEGVTRTEHATGGVSTVAINTQLNKEVKEPAVATIDDPHADKRMTSEEAHDFLKLMLTEETEKGVRMNDSHARDRIMGTMSEIFPADHPVASTNKDFKEAKKQRIAILDNVWKEVLVEYKNKLIEAEKQKEKEATEQVSKVINDAQELLKSVGETTEEKKQIVPTKIPEKTLKVTPVDLNNTQKKEGKEVTMEQATTVDLATCTLAAFKKELENDYSGIIADEEYSEESERFKKWVENVNSRIDQPDSINIISTEKRPKQAINFLKSQLGVIKKNNINLSKKSA